MKASQASNFNPTENQHQHLHADELTQMDFVCNSSSIKWQKFEVDTEKTKSVKLKRELFFFQLKDQN